MKRGFALCYKHEICINLFEPVKIKLESLDRSVVHKLKALNQHNAVFKGGKKVAKVFHIRKPRVFRSSCFSWFKKQQIKNRLKAFQIKSRINERIMNRHSVIVAKNLFKHTPRLVRTLFRANSVQDLHSF